MVPHRYVISLLPIAALACGVARDVGGAAQTGCTTCHGDAARSGSELSRAAPDQGAHLAHLQRGVACASCHVVPTSRAHANGVVEVVFSGPAVAGGATPALVNGTCSGVYCHGATLGAGGRAAAPSWTGGPLGCDACHGAPPPSHAASSTACGVCHPGTVKADGTIDVANGMHADGQLQVNQQHPTGWRDPAAHGPAAKQDLASCQACHGAAFDGGSTGVSCDACHAAAGYAAWTSNCTFCHGAKARTYAPSQLGSAAPPLGTRGETQPAERAVGAHQAHLTGARLGTPVACSECHAIPADLSHLDGTAQVRFGPAASRGTTPSWNGTTCAATYCHGATLTGGAQRAPAWTGGAAEATGCGACHGAPPSTGRHADHAQRSCGDCHPGYTAAAVNGTTHVDGQRQTGNRIGSYSAATRTCTNSCHGSETW